MLETDRIQLVKNLEVAYKASNFIRNDINKLKKINESIDFIKEENLNKALLSQQDDYKGEGEEEEEEEEEIDLQALLDDSVGELKPIIKAKNKQESNINK